MADFSHLARYNVAADRVVPYRIAQLEDEPILQVAPATEANKPYFNALLSQTKESLRSLQAAGATSEAMEQQRSQAKELFAEHVIRGWSGVRDSAGQEVPWSRENARAYLDALPGWIFDHIRSFCVSPNNFVAPKKARAAELEQTAKN